MHLTAEKISYGQAINVSSIPVTVHARASISFIKNIRGLRSKRDYFEIDNIYLQILCLSEHHMEEQDLLHLTLTGYVLGSSFCQRNLQRGMCVFLLGNTKFTTK
jgi:hypothetical protein